MNYPYTELDEIFSTLPESVRDFITSDDVQATLDLIVDDFKIAPQNVEDFKKHVFMLLIGKIAVVDLEDYLINTLHINSTESEEVLEYLDATIDTTLDLLKKAVDSTSISELKPSTQTANLSSAPQVSTPISKEVHILPSIKDISTSDQPVPLIPKPQVPSSSSFSSSNFSIPTYNQPTPDHVLENPVQNSPQQVKVSVAIQTPSQSQPSQPSILDAKLRGATTQTQEEVVLGKPTQPSRSQDPYREPPTA